MGSVAAILTLRIIAESFINYRSPEGFISAGTLGMGRSLVPAAQSAFCSSCRIGHRQPLVTGKTTQVQTPKWLSAHDDWGNYHGPFAWQLDCLGNQSQTRR